jgi:Arc/MetJ-type ribon-helix-helix transcriptional regulator
MDPITLRIQTELLSEIDSEADDLGYSSRAEYIRQLLQNRGPTREMLAADGSAELANPETVATNTEDIQQLQQQLSAAVERIEALEERINAREDKTKTSSESDGQAEPDAGSTSISKLESWVTDHGPQKEKAVSIILFAAELLQEDGPLETGELKSQLQKEFPDAYGSEKTLWGATVQRFYQDAPGFNKPEYGTYNFE